MYSSNKFIKGENVDYAFVEVHERITGQHLGAQTLANNILRDGYYFSSMVQDVKEYVKKCDQCQRQRESYSAPSTKFHMLTSTWTFSQWGMYILGPFPPATGQLKYLIVAINYFTKWVEVEALVKITTTNILEFIKRSILARFGVPQDIVTANGTQFIDMKLNTLEELKVKQHFELVNHPQTNIHVEATNQVLLKGLKRRLEAAKAN